MTRRWFLGMMGVAATGCSKGEEVYREFPSPDGRFKIVVRRKKIWPASMPGQASDAPGMVQLVAADGRVLQETKVDAVQQVEQVEWEPRRVRIKLVAEWDLPG